MGGRGTGGAASCGSVVPTEVQTVRSGEACWFEMFWTCRGAPRFQPDHSCQRAFWKAGVQRPLIKIIFMGQMSSAGLSVLEVGRVEAAKPLTRFVANRDHVYPSGLQDQFLRPILHENDCEWYGPFCCTTAFHLQNVFVRTGSRILPIVGRVPNLAVMVAHWLLI